MNVKLFVTAVALAGAAQAAINPASVPEIGQLNRYRAAPRDSLLSVVPVDAAEFLVGQHFDISVELHNVGNGTVYPDLSKLDAKINGQSLTSFFGKQYTPKENWNFTYFENNAARDIKKPTPVGVTRLSLRSVKINKAGSYKLTLKAGNQKVEANWIVRGFSQRKAQNLVLFIGDGMAPSMISAARYISRKTAFGKFGDNFLEMEKLGTIGKVATNGIDAILTDSANSASSYHTGHKTWVNAMGVYSDTSAGTLDDPKVETLAEIIRRERPGMCIGIVSTAEVQDATPAAVFAHTRRRSDKAIITDQAINPFNGTGSGKTWDVKPVVPDVLLGGGGEFFCAGQAGCASLNKEDYYAKYQAKGYQIVKNKDELKNYKGTKPLLGIFTKNNLDTWLDRNVYPDNLLISKSSPNGDGTTATKQPGLEEMTMTAIKTMDKRCKDGWFLMAEGAAVDKSMHPLDFDRGLSELLELDRTVKAVKDHDAKNYKGKTAIIVTADHAQGYDVFGSVDTQYFNAQPNNDDNKLPEGQFSESQRSLQVQKRLAIGNYGDAGWPSLVVDDKTGLPIKWEERFKLAGGKIDGPQHTENFQLHVPAPGSNPLSRSPAVTDAALTAVFGTAVAVQNPNATLEPHGIDYNPNLLPGDTQSVHTLQAVDLYCGGPDNWKWACAKPMDNTEVFFIMADALGLGKAATSGTGSKYVKVKASGSL
ncbi:hypothetical protein HK097_010684 [Rhizophlyctis rosea]|uniref:alkaline phosphatase n=1 Tax=Rhizophlyctis rosea TaxID=64517 RepID=A0AAD5S7B2_9FUNG|nr:hypothetical protein HK097_010684 [Rhizophlyctis rosea]